MKPSIINKDNEKIQLCVVLCEKEAICNGEIYKYCTRIVSGYQVLK